MVENHCASLARTCIYMPVSVNGRGTYDTYWGQALVCVSLLYFLINPHNPMRCHHFLSFSNEEILAQGICGFPKASQQTSGGAGIRTLSPQAQCACSLLPPCSPSWEKSVHHKIILTLIPWDAFYLLFLFYPQSTTLISWLLSLCLFGKLCWVLLPSQLLAPPSQWPLARFRLLITAYLDNSITCFPPPSSLYDETEVLGKAPFSFCLFRAAPGAYGSSQVRGQLGAVAAGLHHSHSHTRSEPHLQPTPQLMATLAPWPTDQSQGSNTSPHGY